MKKSMWQIPFVVALALLGLGSAGTIAQAEANAGEKGTTYSVRHSVAVKQLPAGTKRVRIWFWLPQEDDAQKVLDLTVAEAPGKVSIHRDPTYGSRYLYAEVSNPTAETLSLVTDFTARRTSLSTTLPAEASASLTPLHRSIFAEQLRKDVPNQEVDERVQALADQICGTETRVIQQARRIYDYVINTADHYSKPGAPKSSQIGSASYCLANRGGACTDMHSLFMVLARAKGIPTRIFFGSRLQPQNEGKVSDPGYRCWVAFFAPGHGWIPCDLAAGDTVSDKRDFYFGNLDDRRILFNEGRDLSLAPAQDGPRPNLVIGAYVEVDGKPHTAFERTLRFTEVK